MIAKLRMWRLERAYRMIAVLEQKVDVQGASRLRIDFANDTVRAIDAYHKRNQISRTQRRQMKRALVNGHG